MFLLSVLPKGNLSAVGGEEEYSEVFSVDLYEEPLFLVYIYSAVDVRAVVLCDRCHKSCLFHSVSPFRLSGVSPCRCHYSTTLCGASVYEIAKDL